MSSQQDAGARQALRPQLHKPDAEGGRGEAAVGLGGAIGGGRADPLLNSQLAEAACYPWTWTAAGVGTPLPRRPERRAVCRSAPGAPPAAPRRGRVFGATRSSAKQRAAPEDRGGSKCLRRRSGRLSYRRRLWRGARASVHGASPNRPSTCSRAIRIVLLF